jgi:hypothetical protein
MDGCEIAAFVGNQSSTLCTQSARRNPCLVVHYWSVLNGLASGMMTPVCFCVGSPTTWSS